MQATRMDLNGFLDGAISYPSISFPADFKQRGNASPRYLPFPTTRNGSRGGPVGLISAVTVTGDSLPATVLSVPSPPRVPMSAKLCRVAVHFVPVPPIFFSARYADPVIYARQSNGKG